MGFFDVQRLDHPRPLAASKTDDVDDRLGGSARTTVVDGRTASTSTWTGSRADLRDKCARVGRTRLTVLCYHSVTKSTEALAWFAFSSPGRMRIIRCTYISEMKLVGSANVECNWSPCITAMSFSPQARPVQSPLTLLVSARRCCYQYRLRDWCN